MLTSDWQTDFIIFEAILIMPMYAILMGMIMSNRANKLFSSHYYTLVISLSITDFSAVGFFVFITSARYWDIGTSLMVFLEPYGSARFVSVTGTFLLQTRDIGVTLIAIQRYFALCQPNFKLRMWFQLTSPVKLICFHWLLSLIIGLPSIIAGESYFDSTSTIPLRNVLTIQYKTVSAITTILLFIICITITSFVYVWMARVLIRSSQVMDSAAKRSRRGQEIRFGVHVLVLTAMLCVTCVFLAYINLKWLFQEGPISPSPPGRTIASFVYPMISCNIAFINPILLVTLNHGVQSLLKTCFLPRKIDSGSSIMLA